MSAKRIGLTALLVAAAFSGGVVFSRPSLAGRFNPYQKLGVFSKVLSYIETHYVEDISETELMYGAARGLTDVLDPHSRFMDPEEYDRLKKETEGNEEINGIGIDVEKRKNRLVIISPIEGSPAAKAGIEPGDVIKRVDGVEVGNLEFDDAVSRMQGPPGSEVVLVIDRRGRELTFRLRRPRYELKPVEGKMLEDGIGYIKIRLFAATTDSCSANCWISCEAQSEGLRGLVLDLRRNPGGLLDQGERVADRFIAEGLIVKTVGKGGRVMDEARAHAAAPAGLPHDRARRRRDGVGGRDRGRGAAGSRARHRAGHADLRKGIGADGDRRRRLRRQALRSEDHRGAVLHPERPLDPGEGDHAERRGGGDGAAGRSRRGGRPARARSAKAAAQRAGRDRGGGKRLDDYQLQMALDYLRSWAVFAKQTGEK